MTQYTNEEIAKIEEAIEIIKEFFKREEIIAKEPKKNLTKKKRKELEKQKEYLAKDLTWTTENRADDKKRILFIESELREIRNNLGESKAVIAIETISEMIKEIK